MGQNDYYVYVYLNQLKSGFWTYKENEFKFQPFYVGKGRRKRESIHLCPFMLNKKNVKNSVIKSIINKSGELPLHYRIYENLTNEEAKQIEIDFIHHFGRIDQKTGILANGTDGGDGANNFSIETLKKIGRNKRKVHQYNLDGSFVKTWPSLTATEKIFKNIGNISTAIKRGGTCNGYMWSYSFKKKLISKIKFQMPIKYSKIGQIDIQTNKIINVFTSALDIEKTLKLREGARNKIYECLSGKLKTAYGYRWQIQK